MENNIKNEMAAQVEEQVADNAENTEVMPGFQLETGASYKGFVVKSREYINEIKSAAYMMEHEVSGARLLYLANDDDNKVFTISFRTPVEDNSGVPHIMEHSTLCGSRKYPLKEPFVELVKGSLNTFLNAMTYPDKTVYPVASRNDKDFRNLMDVYLDAVFYPLIYKNMFTLKQEGWHYELDEKTDNLVYNGVVYNEMKGVYSSSESLLDFYGRKALFPDTTYRFESGGLPSAVPSLTQEDFENFHKKYYSPENSQIYIYGDMDIMATLEHLDSYLADFTRTGEVDSAVHFQKPFTEMKEVDETYPVPEEETDLKDKTYMELQIVAGSPKDVKKQFALHLLENLLMDSETGVLRRDLMDAGFAKDITGSYSGSALQNVISIRASGTNKEDKKKFIDTVCSSLKKIRKEGFDKDLVEAALNSAEFKSRENNFGVYPKGLIYGLSCLDIWNFDYNPLEIFHYDELYSFLREKVKGDYLEELLEEEFINNKHCVLVTLEPEPGKEVKEQEELAAKLAEIKASMSDEELKEVIALSDELHKRQETEDSPEALATIPLLERKDIQREVDVLDVEKEAVEGGTLLYQELPVNKICYVRFAFDYTGIAPELHPYVALLTDIIGKFNTADYSYGELAKYEAMYTGGISVSYSVNHKISDYKDYILSANLSGKVLSDKLDKLFNIIESFILRTDYSDKARLKELILRLKAEWDNNFFARGLNVAVSRLGSYYSPAMRVQEQDDFSQYRFITELADNFEEKADELIAKLEQVHKILFNKTQFILSFSCEREDYARVRNTCLDFVAKLPESDVAGKAPIIMDAPGLNEGITTSGKVQYVTAGGNFKDHGYEYTGAMAVLATILRYEYLWTRIRVQGGAYGANAIFGVNGNMALTTYRDPQLEKSLEAFRNLPEWLEKLELSDREMTKYVIGTISGFDTPLTNQRKVTRALLRELVGMTDELRQKNRNQVLDVVPADIRAIAEIVREVLQDNYLCVVGGETAINGAKNEFASIIKA